jgi:Predicted phosphohydrolases
MVGAKGRALGAFAACACLLPACLLLSSCGVGLYQLFGRDDTPNSRGAEASDRDQAIAAQEALIAKAIPPGSAFCFVFAADLHFGSAKGPREQALSGLAHLAAQSGADFVLFGGDLADKGAEEEYRAFVAYASSLKAGAGSHVGEGAALPWFAAIGNHDLYNSGWKFYKKYIGPSQLDFPAGSARIYCIDTGSGCLGEDQLESLGRSMAVESEPKIVASHYPVRGAQAHWYYKITNTRERAELLSIFNGGGVKLLLCGHWHEPDSADCGNFEEFIPGSLIDARTDGKGHAAVVKVAADGTLASCERYAF